MTMDYSPWSEREIWLFLRVAVSLKAEKPRPPKSVYMHVTSTHTCTNFLSRFQLINFFDDHPWSEREIWLFFEGSGISESRKATPTKIGVHACNINAYLHEFFELIPFD